MRFTRQRSRRGERVRRRAALVVLLLAPTAAALEPIDRASVAVGPRGTPGWGLHDVVSGGPRSPPDWAMLDGAVRVDADCATTAGAGLECTFARRGGGNWRVRLSGAEPPHADLARMLWAWRRIEPACTDAVPATFHVGGLSVRCDDASTTCEVHAFRDDEKIERPVLTGDAHRDDVRRLRKACRAAGYDRRPTELTAPASVTFRCRVETALWTLLVQPDGAREVEIVLDPNRPDDATLIAWGMRFGSAESGDPQQDGWTIDEARIRLWLSDAGPVSCRFDAPGAVPAPR